MRGAAFWSHPEPSWKQLGPSRRPKMPPSWLQEASRWLYVGSSWPQDAQNGLPRPPRCLKNASGRPQDDMTFQVGSSWLYVGSMVALCWLKLALCWPYLGPKTLKIAPCCLKTPKMASRGLQKPNLVPCLIKNYSFWNSLDLQNPRIQES